MTEKGKGRVVNDAGFVSTVKYEVISTQQFFPSGTPDYVKMELKLFGCTPEIPFPLENNAFTLEMEDGRILNFCVREAGWFVPTGGIRKRT
jgi:hypothetical protein